ncbi:DUF3367 domain-containing protein, partial [Actinoplanes sp. NPDC051633]
RAVRVDGWQQAFVVPAGAGGAVTLRFTPDRPYRSALAIGAGCALLVALAAFLPARRRRRSALVTALADQPLAARALAAQPPPAPAPARGVPGGGWWMAVPLMMLAVLLGGAAGASLLLAAMIVRQLRPGALPGIVIACAGAGLTVALSGRLLGHGQEWAYGAAVQVAMLAAVCAVAATLAPLPGQPSRRNP